ncbi:MAG TPA: type II toxin-antitoxin system RelE/ParE family toxin [Patescibacteria group bacterium]|nr:type II toxin-antitoxin system RelE/ParE family toxin [Patescibacteria group bacterium]
MYHIVISPQAKKELKSIIKIYRKGVSEAIESLKDDPWLGKPLTRELTGRFSYRIGVYRIIYKIKEKEKIVYIFSAGHRATIYG